MSDIASNADLIFKSHSEIVKMPLEVILGFVPALLELIAVGLIIYVFIYIFKMFVR